MNRSHGRRLTELERTYRIARLRLMGPTRQQIEQAIHEIEADPERTEVVGIPIHEFRQDLEAEIERLKRDARSSE